MKTEQTNQKQLKLKRCAYLFHDSNSRFIFGTAEQIKEKKEVNSILKSFHDEPAKTNNWIDYEEEENGQKKIVIDNHIIYINNSMIKETNNPTDLVNHFNRFYFANLLPIANFKIYSTNNKDSDNWAYSKKLKSLCIDNYFTPEAKDIDYIRIHFKNNYIEFVIDDNNNYYILNCYDYKPVTKKELTRQLQADSVEAQKELKIIFDTIEKANQEHNTTKGTAQEEPEKKEQKFMKQDTQKTILEDYNKLENILKDYLTNIKTAEEKNKEDLKEKNNIIEELRRKGQNLLNEGKSWADIDPIYKDIHIKEQDTQKHYILNRYIKNVYQNILYIYGYFVELEAIRFCKNNRDFNGLLKLFGYDQNKTIYCYKGDYEYFTIYFKNYSEVKHNHYVDILEYDYDSSKSNFTTSKLKTVEEEQARIEKNIKQYLTNINIDELKQISYKKLLSNIEKLLKIKNKHEEEQKALNSKHAEEVEKADPLKINNYLTPVK